MSILYKNSPLKESSELRRVQVQQDDDAVKKMDYMYDSDTRTPIYESYVTSSCSMFDDDNDNGGGAHEHDDDVYKENNGVRRNHRTYPVTPLSLDLKADLSAGSEMMDSPQPESTSDLNSNFTPRSFDHEDTFITPSPEQPVVTSDDSTANATTTVTTAVRQRDSAATEEMIAMSVKIAGTRKDEEEEEAAATKKMQDFHLFIEAIESKFPESVADEPYQLGHDFNADVLAKQLLQRVCLLRSLQPVLLFSHICKHCTALLNIFHKCYIHDAWLLSHLCKAHTFLAACRLGQSVSVVKQAASW